MSDNVSRVQRDSKVPVVNLPNALTVLRLILVPVFVILGLQSTSWTALSGGLRRLRHRGHDLSADHGALFEPVGLLRIHRYLV